MKLSIFNEQRRRTWWISPSPPEPLHTSTEPGTRNGLECDDCGGDLVDTLPGYVATVFPGKTAVRCLQCGLTESRVI
jgi:hypothetical protein